MNKQNASMLEILQEKGKELGLIVHSVEPDPGYFMLHVYTDVEGNEHNWKEAANELASYIYNEHHVVNRIYKGVFEGWEWEK